MSNSIKKPLTTKTIEAMKPKDPDKADIGEYSGLRVTCGKTGLKTFFYRYSSPITQKLTQVKIGSFPAVSLAEARKQLKELKHIRLAGRCPASELKKYKKEQANQKNRSMLKILLNSIYHSILKITIVKMVV
ncbi:Arm DNA-binding domain-containing protein [Rodentibacter genomosp. 1]|uniref:Arm DNA-binding domain-containing protein n=1 Tax=Rodentibacter genomosp. 1 TaxID=1908264 RepID=UPI001FCA4053|nr:Arm DNA-binding domain-containing protein [Rodentibacter genomosp. 1]